MINKLPWKKWGQDSNVGEPNWQALTLKTPEGVLQLPSGLLQNQALSGFSAGVPNTSEGGTNLKKGIWKKKYLHEKFS